mgnify:CR=1 FL=1
MAIYKKDGVDGVNSFPRKLVTLVCSLTAGSSIAKGDWVQIDTSITTEGVGSGCKTSTSAGVAMVFGVATETVTNNTSSTATFNIQVQTAGRCTFAKLNVSEIANGQAITGHDGTTDGVGHLYDAADINPICGICLAEAADDTAASTVMIIDQGYF